MLRRYIFIVLAIFILAGFMFSSQKAFCERRAATPIFDGNDGSPSLLRLQTCYEDDYSADNKWDLLIDPKLEKSKKFKSKKWTAIVERWYGRNKGILIISRSYFGSPEDARLYPEISMFSFMDCPSGGAPPFPGWSHEIGDGNFWVYDEPTFVKKNVLVTIGVNSRVLGRDYKMKIARIIEKRL
jgi:hypothetical protein